MAAVSRMSDIDWRDGWAEVGDAWAGPGYVLSSESCAREDIAELKVRGVRGVGGLSGKDFMSDCAGVETCREVEGVDVMAVASKVG